MFRFLAEPAADNSNLFLMIGIALVFVALLFFSSRSQRKRRKQAEEMNKKLVVGSKVKTIGGIVGEISALDDFNGTFTITSGNSIFVIDRNAVYSFELFGNPSDETEITETESEVITEEETVEPTEVTEPEIEEIKNEEVGH